jgi:hypothetical protein
MGVDGGEEWQLLKHVAPPSIPTLTLPFSRGGKSAEHLARRQHVLNEWMG